MKTRRWWLIFMLPLGLALACGQSAHAQPASPAYLITAWTTKEGLPQNTIYDIRQTRDGYLWFTTLDGLVRYDGVRFHIFNKSNAPGLPSNRITCLFEDADGALWVGTEDAGAVRYAQGKFTAFTTSDGLPHNLIHEIEAEPKGGVRITTRDGFAFWQAGRLLPNVELADSSQRKRYLAPSGALWTLTPAGLRRSKDGLTTDYGVLVKIDDLRVARLYEDRQGQLWFGAYPRVLFKIKGDTITRYGPQHGLPAQFGLSAILEDSQGALWFGTTAGLLRLHQGQFTRYTKQDGLADNDVAALFEDREGNLWAGTNTGGINRLSRKFITTYSTAAGLHNGNVYPILEDRAGHIWIGASDSLMRFADGRFTNYLNKDGLPSIHVQSLHEDRAGRLWIGDYGGLGWLENGRYNLANFIPKGNVNALHEDRAGNLWVGSEHGLFKCREGACVTYNTQNGLPGQNVKMIYEDRRGDLWIGTYGGLARWRGDQFTAWTERDGLASDRVRYIYEDAEGVFWIGTYDGGLSRFKEGRFTNYRVEQGLYNNGVFQILEDARGLFWIGCNKGIYRVSKQQLNDFAAGKISSIICAAYDQRDGMLSAECNGGRQPGGLRARDGKLWFPSLDGAVVVDAAAAPLNLVPPPVWIEAVVLDRTNLPLGQEVRIAPQQKYLEISYTGLSFVKSEQAQFKYKLAGQDTDWQEAGTRRVAYYSYLPPGSYTFNVIAANSDGVWNQEGAALRIEVLPPYWQRWWFVVLATLSLVAVVALAYQQRLRQSERARRAQEQFARQLLASQEGERKRIAAELHDSLGQRLIVIKNLALLLLHHSADAETTTQRVEEISGETSQAIHEVKEISYNLRPHQLDQLGLSKTIESLLRRVGNSSGIPFSIAVENIDGLLSKEAEIHLYRIVQECVSNIVKHAQATTASVEITRQPDGVRLTIEDNGRGFNPNHAPAAHQRSFGLLGLAERTRMLGGTQTIRSVPDQGTTIIIHIGHVGSQN